MSKATHLDRLQGSWRVTALEVDGQPMPDDMLDASSIVIKGRRFTSTGMGAVYKGVISVDDAVAPSRIDMKFDAGPEKGNTNLGIYELTGDTWRLCLATRGSERPASFATRAGSGLALETLVRGEAASARPKKSGKSAPAAVPHDPRPTGFEGEWQMLSGVMNGSPMEESAVKWARRVTTGSLTTVVAGPNVLLRFEFTVRPPREIDYLNTAGPNKGKAQVGIYEFDGDVLRVCVAAPGDERPAEFDSQPGDRRTLTVWKRLH